MLPPKIPWLLVSAVVLALPLSGPTRAEAQHPGPTSNEEANRVHAAALDLLNAQEAPSWDATIEAAIALHARAVELRLVDDPRFFDCVNWQAELLFYSDDLREARVMFERAGDGALATGDPYRAALAYVRAAMLAKDLDQPEQALRLGEKARLLSYSPVMSEEERAQISRFVGG